MMIHFEIEDVTYSLEYNNDIGMNHMLFQFE